MDNISKIVETFSQSQNPEPSISSFSTTHKSCISNYRSKYNFFIIWKRRVRACKIFLTINYYSVNSKKNEKVAVESLEVDEEKKLRAECLKMIIKQEQEAYELKRQHDEDLLYVIAVREAEAKAALAELLLKKEINKD